MRERDQNMNTLQTLSLSHSPALNYFQCQHIFEELKKVDGNGKSLFGKFLSTRVQVVSE